MSKPTVIAITGRAQSGKDTFLARLKAQHPRIIATSKSFASPLKEAANLFFPAIDWFGDERTQPENRRFMQRFGDGVRERDPFGFIFPMLKTIEIWGETAGLHQTKVLRVESVFAVPDCRYFNELHALTEWCTDHDLRLVNVHIDRPSGPTPDHLSEAELAILVSNEARGAERIVPDRGGGEVRVECIRIDNSALLLDFEAACDDTLRRIFPNDN